MNFNLFGWMTNRQYRRSFWVALTLLGAISASFGQSQATPVGAVLTGGFLQFPAGFMPSVKDYGAVGDGVTDDTAAIQAALADGRSNASSEYNGAPKGQIGRASCRERV